MAGSSTANDTQPVFYYDLGCPRCYLVAETIMATLPVVPEWEPVLGSDIAGPRDPDRGHDRDRDRGRDPDRSHDPDRSRDPDRGHDPDRSRDPDRGHDLDLDLDRGEIARRAADLGLQPVRWPSRWPPDTEQAMLAATYAKQIGRAVAFSLAAFRQAFAGGRDLTDENTILIAGAACEMHPTALRKGTQLRSTGQALNRATRRAQDAGARSLPAIQVADRVYDTVEAATAALRAAVR